MKLIFLILRSQEGTRAQLVSQPDYTNGKDVLHRVSPLKGPSLGKLCTLANTHTRPYIKELCSLHLSFELSGVELVPVKGSPVTRYTVVIGQRDRQTETETEPEKRNRMITIIIMAKAHFGRKRGDAERNDDDGKLYFCSCAAASAADDDELCEPTCPAKGQVGLEWNGMGWTAQHRERAVLDRNRK